MAISRGGYRLLLEECKRRPFEGNVMELGRSTVYLLPNELTSWAEHHGVELKPFTVHLSNVIECADVGSIDDVTLFTALGFDSIHSCDISDCDNATHNIDLNQPIPSSLADRFDVIIDSGTIEHIFDLKAVLINIHQMLKVGGRAIFISSPVSNYVDHGYYMYSPQLFYDYFHVNKYNIVSFYIIFFKRDFLRDPWIIYLYQPGSLDEYCYGGMPNDMMVSFWLCVEKTENSLCGVIPQQGDCRQICKTGNAKEPFICLGQL